MLNQIETAYIIRIVGSNNRIADEQAGFEAVAYYDVEYEMMRFPP
jgi:hypothetical protein